MEFEEELNNMEGSTHGEEERFRVLKESGYKTVEKTMAILQEQGYRIKRIDSGMVPFCEGADGQPVLVEGWSIVTERPRPKSPPSATPSQGDTAPWLWG